MQIWSLHFLRCPKGQTPIWGLVLETGALPPPPGGSCAPLLPVGVDMYYMESLPLTALRPRTAAAGAGGAAEVLFTDQGFPFSLWEGLGPLIRHSYSGWVEGTLLSLSLLH